MNATEGDVDIDEQQPSTSSNIMADNTQAKEPDGVSRRRMAFRPIGQINHIPRSNQRITKAQKASEKKAAVVTQQQKQQLQQQQQEKGESPKKKAKSWDVDEIMAYYEGIKQYGKDFDGVMKIMAKRKILKDKDQTKNYYFNSLKFLKQHIGLDEKIMGEVNRDAQELFIAINACEWKRKTNGLKYQPDKLRELILEGATCVRVKKKTLVVKTPSCPSLMKLFTQNRRVDKFPSDIILVLHPKDYSHANVLMARNQNPFIKMRISTNERLKRIFSLLESKWNSSYNRFHKSGNDIVNKCSSLQVKFFASNQTVLGKMVPVEINDCPSVAISFNKLRKELTDIENHKMGRTDNQNETKLPAISYSVQVPNAFTLNEKMLAEGLCADNIGDATVAELYCLCGMTPKIILTYTTKAEKRPNAPWNILCSIIKRNYSDALYVKKEDDRKRERTTGGPDKNEPPSKIRSQRGSRSKSIADKVLSNTTVAQHQQQAPNSNETQAVHNEDPNMPTLPRPPPILYESSIVVKEMEAFEEQYRQIQAKKKQRNPRRQQTRFISSTALSTTQSLITEFTAGKVNNINPSTQSNQQMVKSTKPKTYISQFEARKAYEQAKKLQDDYIAEKESKEIISTRTNTAATDFSSIASINNHSGNSNCEQSAATNFLSSLRTPQKTPIKSTQISSTPDRNIDMMQRLFGGDVSLSPSQHNATPIKTTTTIPADQDDESTRDFMAGLFGDVSFLSPLKVSKGGNDSFTDKSGALPVDVQDSFDDMMNQNSLDYFKRFEQLADKLEVSKKKNS